jgi:hypothetical protein
MITKVQIDQLWKQFREAINKAYDHAAKQRDDDGRSLLDYAENMTWSDSLVVLLKRESANEKQHRNSRPSIPGFSVETAAKLILLNQVAEGSQLSEMPKATSFLVYRKTAMEARVIGFLVRAFLPAGFHTAVESLDYATLMQNGGR